MVSKFFRFIILALCFMPAHGFAAGFYLAPQTGYIGNLDAGTGADASAIGFGSAFGYDTGDIFSIETSLTFAQFNKQNTFNVPVALRGRFYDMGDLLLNARFGAGFLKSTATRFFLDFGVDGDFFISQNVGVGLSFRYDTVFDGPNQLLVLMRLVLKFQTTDTIWD